MINLSVKINSEEKSYPIIIGDEEISVLPEKIFSYMQGKKALIVISEKVDKLYGKALNIDKIGHCRSSKLIKQSENKVDEEIEVIKFILKDGEKEKNFKNYKKITDLALKMQITRKDIIVAIGGGVVGDIAGFAASTYMRGIDYIQVPTTLLACVDSSVGGKVAVNTDYGKNLVGAFYQPKAVLINTNFLNTLDSRQFKTGLGEVVKYSFIEKSCKCDEEFHLTNFLTENANKILDYDSKILQELIRMCVSLKISVVGKDEKEGNLRKILNFGHTYGHAIEKMTNYNTFTHGEAIVAGMDFVFNLALKKCLIDKNYKFFADDIIKKFDFKLVPEYKISALVALMKMDKKATSDKIIFILPTDYFEVKEFEFDADEICLLNERSL